MTRGQLNTSTTCGPTARGRTYGVLLGGDQPPEPPEGGDSGWMAVFAIVALVLVTTFALFDFWSAQ